MNLAELVCQFRLDVQDPVLPGPGVSDDGDSLWSFAEIVRYADLAQRDFAVATEMFRDRTSFVPAVTAADPLVTLDWRILKVESAKLVSTNRALKLMTVDQFEFEGGGFDDYGGSAGSAATWEDRTGTPRVALTDYETRKLRLVPIPVAADTLRLTAIRTPLKELKAHSVMLEVTDPKHQDALLDGMKKYAYLKQDADAFNEDASAKAAAAFERKVAAVKRQLDLLYKPAGAVQYGGL